MKKILLVLVLLGGYLTAWAPNNHVVDYREEIKYLKKQQRLRMVIGAIGFGESSNIIDTINKSSGATGYLQETPIFVKDINQHGFFDGVTGEKFTFEDTKNPRKAILMFLCYQLIYNPTFNEERMIRIHYAGPTLPKSYSDEYYKKIKKLLDSNSPHIIKDFQFWPVESRFDPPVVPLKMIKPIPTNIIEHNNYIKPLAMSTQLDEKTYKLLIDVNIAELNKYMPEHSIEKKHIIAILEWSVQQIYHPERPKVLSFRERREALGLTLREVAKEIRTISAATISRIEQGKDSFFKSHKVLDDWYKWKGV